MSEFSGAGTLGKLLGGGGTDGILAEKIHAHPYCVILLDEFEKACTDIHDLFLQILDEGYFTNTNGKKIDLRNTIIIATSNAGGRLIFKTSSIRAENPNLDSEIINHIINENILRPELINRFDSTIIFEPLDETEQGKVADILLRDLTSRVEKQGYYLQITPELKRQLTEQGYSPEFGGRGMGRIIQDVVEEKIAQKIISGEVVKGGTIILTDKDF
jgi:ATP-dependent Clp protease ATP-binding subunit ClpC